MTAKTKTNQGLWKRVMPSSGWVFVLAWCLRTLEQSQLSTKSLSPLLRRESSPILYLGLYRVPASILRRLSASTDSVFCFLPPLCLLTGWSYSLSFTLRLLHLIYLTLADIFIPPTEAALPASQHRQIYHSSSLQN